MHRYLIAVTTTDVHVGWIVADSEAEARDIALDEMPAWVSENSVAMKWRPKMGGRTAALIGADDMRSVVPAAPVEKRQFADCDQCNTFVAGRRHTSVGDCQYAPRPLVYYPEGCCSVDGPCRNGCEAS